MKNTFAATLDGDLKNILMPVSGTTKFKEASLDRNNIPLSVYDNLIKAVHENLDAMYKYMDIRKRAWD